MPSQTLIQHPEDIQLDGQDEIDQILGHPPSWLLRSGISIVLLTTLMFIFLSWLIKYPDIIQTEVEILTENPAIRVVPLVNGKIEDFLVENQEFVQKEDLLMILESPVQRNDIIKLEKLLNELVKIDQSQAYLEISFLEDLTLGQLQGIYADLVQKVEDYKYFFKQNRLFGKIKSLRNQIKYSLGLNKVLQKQQRSLVQEVNLTKKNYARSKKLNKEGIISNLELEKIETAYLQYQRQLDNSETEIINNKILVEQLYSQIIDLEQNHENIQTEKELSIQQNIQTLKSEIEIWKQSYLIKAPISGRVSLNHIWSTNQFVNANQELLTLVPEEGKGDIIAKAQLPVEKSGKVIKNQIANIRLYGYPYQEYGILKSSVSEIALVPIKEYIQLELTIPDSLITTYNKVIPFSQEMKGEAHIITEDRRILERIFDRFKSIVKNN